MPIEPRMVCPTDEQQCEYPNCLLGDVDGNVECRRRYQVAFLSRPFLTPAELERLAVLAEEMGEALQVIGKILRHGYESADPTCPSPKNRVLLEKELGDVQAAIRLLWGANDIRLAEMLGAMDDKMEKMRLRAAYLHHQPQELVESLR